MFFIFSALVSCVDAQLTSPQKKSTRKEASTDSRTQKSSEPYYNYNYNYNYDSPTEPQTSDCYKGDPLICEIELEIVRQTNSYRQQRSMTDLKPDAELAFVSRDWSKKMNDLYRLNHTGFPSWRENAYQKEFNKSPSFFISAENIAVGYCSGSAEETARYFVDMWWDSSGHRQNMLSDSNYLGAGIYIDQGGECYATQIFGT